MANTAYNNIKNTNAGHTPFELGCSYYLRVSYKEDIDFYSKTKSVNKLFTKL